MCDIELQKKWDRTLLKAWFSTPYTKAGVVAGDFMREHNVDDTQIVDLLRFPHGYEWKLGFMVWVRNSIFKLSKVLDTTEADDVLKRAAILTKLAKSKLTTNKEPSSKYANEFRHIAHQARVGTTMSVLNKRLFTHLAHSNKLSGQWNKCK